MFGESDSESPRVPSPWDSLPPPSSPPKHNIGLPKLVPEADEGNVEYKLQLLSPSPARFARLVTQLKWRLLEGGGQAYYELGVADSGMLVGLPRQELEESLETLEMMAGEIAASVIVVKEIEVPPELSSLAESQLERWDGRRSTRRKDLLRMMKRDGSPTTSVSEAEDEFSTTDVTDVEAPSSYPATPSVPPGGQSNLTQPRSSPNPSPFDPALAMFTMDLTADIADHADDETLDDNVSSDHADEFSLCLEISSVYKPRPMKKRAIHITSALSTHFKYGKKRLKNGYPPSKSTDTMSHTGELAPQESDTHSQPKETEARLRRDKPDKRRELEHSTTPTDVSAGSPTHSIDYRTIIPSYTTNDPHASALESLQVVAVDPQTSDASETAVVVSKEPRLIVEALVVRKMSLDEAFLDFEGFSLQ